MKLPFRSAPLDWTQCGVSVPPDGPPGPVDVVVPVYGAAAELAICLASLRRHTDFGRHRLVLVIDGPQEPAVEESLGASEFPHPRPSSPRPSSPAPSPPPSPGEEGDPQDRSNRVPLSRGGGWEGAGEGTGVRVLGWGRSEANPAPRPPLSEGGRNEKVGG